jgi:hypothetical protein
MGVGLEVAVGAGAASAGAQTTIPDVVASRRTARRESVTMAQP